MSQSLSEVTEGSSSLGSVKQSAVAASNRRDIPVSSFDFTNGAYARSRKTRILSVVVLSFTVLIFIIVLVSTLQNFSKASSYANRALKVEATKQTVISEYETFSDSGTDTLSLVGSYDTITSALSKVAFDQADIELLYTDMFTKKVTGVTLTSLEFNPDATETAETKESKPSVKVSISVTGDSLTSTLAFVSSVSANPLLTNVLTTRTGLNATVVADILLNNPPASLIAKLSTLGIRYDKSQQVIAPVVLDTPEETTGS